MMPWIGANRLVDKKRTNFCHVVERMIRYFLRVRPVVMSNNPHLFF